MKAERLDELKAFAESQRLMKLAAGDDIADILCELIAEVERLQIELSKSIDIDLFNKRISKLQGEIERLHKVIANELSENDELGAEYTYVNCLRDELKQLTESTKSLQESYYKIDEINECLNYEAIKLRKQLELCKEQRDTIIRTWDTSTFSGVETEYKESIDELNAELEKIK